MTIARESGHLIGSVAPVVSHCIDSEIQEKEDIYSNALFVCKYSSIKVVFFGASLVKSATEQLHRHISIHLLTKYLQLCNLEEMDHWDHKQFHIAA